MAIPHAAPGEVIDVRPLGPNLQGSVTTTLIKTERLEVIRLILPTGKEIPTHETRGEITVQCLEGQVEFSTPTQTTKLEAGQLLFLPGGVRHSVKAVEAASVLLTIRL
jgi:quercetin dioxygenase-like cupin family protein